MTISVFDLFSVGIGPSSSHTVGPMRAAGTFVDDLDTRGVLGDVAGVRVDLYGSLAATGAGHGTMSAILLGFEGYRPETIATEEMETRLESVRASRRIRLGGTVDIPLAEDEMVLHPLTVRDFHPNGMTLTATSVTGRELHAQTYYSIGGGFVVTDTEPEVSVAAGANSLSFGSARELLALSEHYGLTISEVMLEHERALRPEPEVRARLLHIRDVMVECQRRGIGRDGYLPGSLRVRRRARGWYERLNVEDPGRDPAFAEDWVNLVALAVNEENASGGRIVTAPTNGAAGIIPAVLHYALHYTPRREGRPGRHDGAIPVGGRRNRIPVQGTGLDLRGEVGCQGEVGSAASMPPPGSRRSSAAAQSRWRTRRRSRWNTVSVSRVIPSAAWCRFRASSATPSRRARRSTPPGWRCAATARTESVWIR